MFWAVAAVAPRVGSAEMSIRLVGPIGRYPFRRMHRSANLSRRGLSDNFLRKWTRRLQRARWPSGQAKRESHGCHDHRLRLRRPRHGRLPCQHRPHGAGRRKRSEEAQSPSGRPLPDLRAGPSGHPGRNAGQWRDLLQRQREGIGEGRRGRLPLRGHAAQARRHRRHELPRGCRQGSVRRHRRTEERLARDDHREVDRPVRHQPQALQLPQAAGAQRALRRGQQPRVPQRRHRRPGLFEP